MGKGFVVVVVNVPNDLYNFGVRQHGFIFRKINEKGLKSFSFNKKSCYKFCLIKNHVISFSFNKKSCYKFCLIKKLCYKLSHCFWNLSHCFWILSNTVYGI